MARADAAAEYLILICLNADLQGEAGKEQASLCHEALRELVLETREFSTLLGDVKANGEGTEGLIKSRLELIKLADENALIRNITQEAAKTADDNGRTNDAVLLCHLAGEYDLVVSILNRSLSEALSVDIGQEPLRLEPLKQRLTTANVPATDPTSTSASMLGTDDPIELAHRIITLYNNNQLWWRKVSKSNRDTLGMLYSLNGAKQSLEVNRYMEALDVSNPSPSLLKDLGPYARARIYILTPIHSKSNRSPSSPSPPPATSPRSAPRQTTSQPTRRKSPATSAKCCSGPSRAAAGTALRSCQASLRIRRGGPWPISCSRRQRI
jgi:hypothetical protein